MIKLNRKTTSYILAFLMILNIGFFRSVANAEGNSDLIINISNYEEALKTKDKNNLDTISFLYWNISKEYNYENFEDEDYKTLSTELESQSIEDLNNKFGEAILSPKSNNYGKININGLQNGLYYFRELENREKYLYTVPFFALILENSQNIEINTKNTGEVPGEEYGNVKLIKKSERGKLLEGVGFELYNITDSGETKVPLNDAGNYSSNGVTKTLFTDKAGEITVNGLPVGKYIFKEVAPLKGYRVVETDTAFEIVANKTKEIIVINEKLPEETGKYKFLKVSNDKNKTPLQGAQFKVSTKEGDTYIDVIRNGKTYFVESNDKGEFIVDNLPYGKYYLWETKAPKDHIQLSSAIEFEINKDSEQKVLVITNKKKPPIEIPKTGDMLVVLILVSSLALFGVGYKMSRQEEENTI